MKQEDMEHLIAKAKELGASAAVPVSVPTIKLGMWTRMKCQYGCPNYGQTLCCPPHAPSAEFTRKFLADYTNSLLVQMTIPYDPEDAKDWNAYDRKIHLALTDLVIGVEREAFLMNYYKALALKAGRCRLCDTCNLKKCVHPDRARPSAEACGIDVMALAADNGFDSRVLRGPVKEFKIYGLILLD